MCRLQQPILSAEPQPFKIPGLLLIFQLQLVDVRCVVRKAYGAAACWPHQPKGGALPPTQKPGFLPEPRDDMNVQGRGEGVSGLTNQDHSVPGQTLDPLSGFKGQLLQINHAPSTFLTMHRLLLRQRMKSGDPAVGWARRTSACKWTEPSMQIFSRLSEFLLTNKCCGFNAS